jgi:PAS domain S-box-containing protein
MAFLRAAPREFIQGETLSMADSQKIKWVEPRAISAILRYGLALVSVVVALCCSQVFLYFHLPQPFTAFALSAIAITYWYGGTLSGIFAALLSLIVRGYYFEPEISAVSRIFYDLVFLTFALLMTRITRTRNELEVRVAERTAALTRANEDLKLEIIERNQAEEKLRQSEDYLHEAQKLGRMGSWAHNAISGTFFASPELLRIFGRNSHGEKPTREMLRECIHPDDRPSYVEMITNATSEKADWDTEYRIVLANGSLRHIHDVAHAVSDGNGELVEYIGTVMDVTERKLAEAALREAQSDLARINRVTTMGELTASLAHEINQPIAATVTNANTCLRWLTREHPDLEEARASALRIVKDGTRAAEIIKRMRLLFKKGTSQREPVDLNEVIREMIVLLRGEATRYSIPIRTKLAADLPQFLADRVQLQQVLMNLMLNGIEAMKEVDGTRELSIKSQRAQNDHVLVSVSDTGVGLPPEHESQIFNAFFTTKGQGTGMGLSISRSIVEAHGGQVWAADNSPCGASFYINLPTKAEEDV